MSLQREVVDELSKLGVVYSYDSRLALFWLRHKLQGLQPVPPSLLEKMDRLVKMRTEGKEPKHSNGRYVQ